MRSLLQCFFVQHNHAISVAILFPPTLSTLTTVCCTFYPTAPHAATIIETFCAGPILATPVCAFVLDALLGLANPATPWLRRLTASTSASTLPFVPCLPRLRRRLSSMSTMALTVSTSASPLSMTTALMRLRHLPGAPYVPAAPSTRQPDHNHVSFFDYGYCTLMLGYLDIGIKGHHLHESSQIFSLVAASAPRQVVTEGDVS